LSACYAGVEGGGTELKSLSIGVPMFPFAPIEVAPIEETPVGVARVEIARPVE
jgi:hypothetical protein